MQLSLLPVAFLQAGLPRSFGGAGAGLSWDSCGHLVGLARDYRGTHAVIWWALRGTRRARRGHCAVHQTEKHRAVVDMNGE